jgi:hypothetical protein
VNELTVIFSPTNNCTQYLPCPGKNSPDASQIDKSQEELQGIWIDKEFFKCQLQSLAEYVLYVNYSTSINVLCSDFTTLLYINQRHVQYSNINAAYVCWYNPHENPVNNTRWQHNENLDDYSDDSTKWPGESIRWQLRWQHHLTIQMTTPMTMPD